MPATVPAADSMEDRQAADQLLASLKKLQHHEGPWYPSPMFGEMDKEKVTQLTLVHSAHHFSFLIPKN